MSSKKLINNELKFTLTFKTQLLTIEYLGGLMKTTQIRFLLIIVIIGFIMSVIAPSPRDGRSGVGVAILHSNRNDSPDAPYLVCFTELVVVILLYLLMV